MLPKQVPSGNLSGTHVALLHSVPHHRSSFNLPGRMGEQFAGGERPALVLKIEL